MLPGIIAITDPMLILSRGTVLGSPQDSTKTLGLYIYQTAFLTGDLRLGYASAISLASSIGVSIGVLFIIFLLRERNQERRKAHG
jgi:ABC-type sugar transport system permease subunit